MAHLDTSSSGATLPLTTKVTARASSERPGGMPSYAEVAVLATGVSVRDGPLI